MSEHPKHGHEAHGEHHAKHESFVKSALGELKSLEPVGHLAKGSSIVGAFALLATQVAFPPLFLASLAAGTTYLAHREFKKLKK